ncbi:hypothetical protein EV361DRAFT_486831 [Lentinula raphanica]|nr:hypothetical protein EV361DRAFT_486831 [Lentinula raphanica]
MTDALINLEELSTCEENTQPIQSFRLFTGEFYCGITALEYHWGLEKGELDLWCPLNRISALVPTVEVLQTLANTVEANFLNPTDQRRSCCNAHRRSITNQLLTILLITLVSPVLLCL